jgi:hypothetical protein
MKTKHENALAALMAEEPRWKKSGLRRAVNEAIRKRNISDGYEETDGEDWEPSFSRHLGFIPDAFRVDPAARTVALLEVEDTSVINKDKLNRIVDFWYGLDCESWFCEVHIYNVFLSKMTILTDADLTGFYLDSIAEEGARVRALV